MKLARIRRGTVAVGMLATLIAACAPDAKSPDAEALSAGPQGAPVAAAPVISTPTAPAPSVATAANGADYAVVGGFPTPDAVQKAYDDADLGRAVQAYKFFYPTVSFSAAFPVLGQVGIKVNQVGGIMVGSPKQVVLTPNSDTPYAIVPLDLSAGPWVVELPPGPFIAVVNDANQRYVMDMGLPGPDAGKGGKHVLLPPGYKEKAPLGYFAGTPSTNRLMVAIRVLPLNGDVPAAVARFKTIKVHPLKPAAGAAPFDWVDISDRAWDGSATSFESGLKYWEVLHAVVDAEPALEAYRMYYGELGALGIEKGKPFAPDARMKAILTKAAKLANDQLRVQSFADRSPERLAWPDRKWEWASLRFENGTFDLPHRKDLVAREKWFFQAIIESPAMFRRDPGAGSLYWLGLRDKTGAYLDGKKTYKLTVPLPVPNKLFWSITLYDPLNRSELATSQGKAALRSLVELRDLGGAKSVDLYFGPKAPAGQEARFIQTAPDRGWFSYFRIYGPEKAAFDGSWKPGDFEEVK